jgi:hypothetical protein
MMRHLQPNPTLHAVLANIDNEYKMFILAWDILKRELKRVEKSGARYIWKIEYDSSAKKMTFYGQSKLYVTATLQELAVGS